MDVCGWGGVGGGYIDVLCGCVGVGWGSNLTFSWFNVTIPTHDQSSFVRIVQYGHFAIISCIHVK